MAKISLRLVPGLTFAKVGRWLTKTAKRLAPEHASVEVRILHGGDPVQVDVDHPAFQVLDEAFKEVVGRGTVPVRAGGSIPVVTQFAKSGSPVILTGIGLPDDGLHSPNEKYCLKNYYTGIVTIAHFFERYGA